MQLAVNLTNDEESRTKISIFLGEFFEDDYKLIDVDGDADQKEGQQERDLMWVDSGRTIPSK